jgi:glycosyltransferase involved in cell wall biosynthesis
VISVIILTHNEETDLPDCLRSLAWCDDLHVVDSGSTDATVALATTAGARVAVHPFESFGKQRNWALANCSLKHEWVLFLDADERSTPSFEAAVKRAITSAPETVAGYYCCWKMMLQGRWLKHCDSFPKWQFRLLRLGKAAFTDFGHGQKEDQVKGTIEYLREPYLHFAFSKGWSHWLRRHDRYSDLEAVQRLQAPIRCQDIFSSHGSIRNKALKPLVSRIPGWPLLIFAIRYLAKLGFLEGRPGFVYCVNMAYYEFLIVIKMEELKRRESAANPPMTGAPSTPAAGNAILKLLFSAALALVLYFALVPTQPNARLHELPFTIRRWLNTHDEFANFTVFCVFGYLAFALPQRVSPSQRIDLSARNLRLVLLLALVVGLELTQLAIPGRFCDWRDIATGSAGVLVAWLVSSLSKHRRQTE